MTKYKNQLILIVSILLTACTNNQDLKFKHVFELQAKEYKTSALLNPMDLLIHDSLLIIKEDFSSKYAITILNKNNGNLISNSLKYGKGPGEIVNLGPVIFSKKNEIIYVSDWGKYKTFKIPISDLVNKQTFNSDHNFKIKNAFMPMMNVFFNSNTKCFGFSSYHLNRNLVNFIDNNGNQIDSLSISNKLNYSFWENAGLSDNPLLLSYNNDKDKIIVASRFDNFISIIDLKGNPVNTKKWNIIDQTVTNEIASWKKINSFSTVVSDENYIYCLYSGKSGGKYNKIKEKIDPIYPKQILIFDWNLNEICKVNLSNEVFTIKLDIHNQMIYGICFDYDNCIIQYDIGKILENI